MDNRNAAVPFMALPLSLQLWAEIQAHRWRRFCERRREDFDRREWLFRFVHSHFFLVLATVTRFRISHGIQIVCRNCLIIWMSRHYVRRTNREATDSIVTAQGLPAAIVDRVHCIVRERTWVAVSEAFCVSLTSKASAPPQWNLDEISLLWIAI